ncbi:MAG: LamG-like jellyroll fold domain-containing protein [Bacteroidota bacterium]
MSLADSADWDFGTGDFTIETQFRANTLQNTQNETALASQVQSYSPHNYWVWFIRSNNIEFVVYSNNSIILQLVATATFNTGTWYHVALVRSGNTWTMYKDGVSIGTITSSITMPDYSLL